AGRRARHVEARHPCVGAVDGEAASPTLVRDELQRVVVDLSVVPRRLNDVGELRIRTAQLEPRERCAGEAGGALEAGDLEERIRQLFVAERRVSTLRHIALILQRSRGLVDAAELRLLFT